MLDNSIIAIEDVDTAAQDPVPEFYWIYSLQDGKLREIYANPDLNDFGPAVRFVVFHGRQEADASRTRASGGGPATQGRAGDGRDQDGHPFVEVSRHV